MGRWLPTLVLLGQLAVVPDAIMKDQARVERDGMKQYEVRRDVINPNHYRVYDRNGQVGTMKRDVLFPDRWRIEENR